MQPPTSVEPFHESDHELSEPVYDIDGFGVDQAEMVDGEPLFTVIEYSVCRREGCAAERHIEYLFTTTSLSDALQRGLEELCEYELYEHLFEWAEMVDYDDQPIIGFESNEIYDAFGVDCIAYCYAEGMDVQAEGTGRCDGHVEPNPDVDAYRYDGL